MKIANLFLIIIIFLLIGACKDEITVVSIIKDGEKLGVESSTPFDMLQNYPNPFNPSTSVTYSVSREMKLKMTLFTEDWEPVKVLFDKVHQYGYYHININLAKENGEAMPSGTYYYALEGGGYILVRQMEFLK